MDSAAARPIEIFFEGVLTGIMSNLENDMWYIDGKWEPVSADAETRLKVALGPTSVKQNFGNWTGPLVEWTQGSEKRYPGLFLGFDNGRAIFRMLTDPTTVELLKNRKPPA
jgi:hypothetical protein